MNRMRWKMMIGGLGLSLAGLAAVAGVPDKTGGLSCTPNPSVHTVARVNPEQPIAVPAPKVADLPAIPNPAAPAPIAGPALPSAGLVALPVTLLPPVVPIAVPESVPPQPLMIPSNSAPLPSILSEPKPIDVVPPPLPPAFELALPAPSSPVMPVVKQPELPKPEPTRIQPVVPDFMPATPPPVLDTLPVRTMSNAPPIVSGEPSRSIEKKLKVILHLGDDRPKFEVRDNEEVYLKVTSERVEVKSPGDAGTAMSQMRAAGKVAFVTPGGEGTCDELLVVPGTGQVIVTGKVSFTYNWGKLETTVSGEKMTFRLGAPAVTAVGAGNVTGVPAGYQRTK